MLLKIASLLVVVDFGTETETENADAVCQDRHSKTRGKRTESAIVVAIDETTDFTFENF